MSITLSALQKQRRDTAANWTAENPTLLAGEIGLESDTGYWKVGNGSTAWTSLAYVTGLGAEIPVSRLADGSARQLLQTAANGTDVEWTSNVDVPGTLDVTGAATFDSNVTIAGDLTVNGTTTTINTQDLLVEDKNVIIGNVTSPTDATADGGGITLKGTTDKTINWVDATDAWTLSEHVNIASGKEYRIDGTKVLDATSLGSSVLITSANITDGTIVNGDVNASAAIAGTKISPDFGSQNVTTTGTVTGASLNPTGSTVPTNGVYLPAANSVAISTNGSGRLFVDANGRLLINNSSAVGSATGVQGALQAQGIDGLANANLGRWSNDSAGYAVYFGKSRGVSIGSQAAVSSGDFLGAMFFEGSDGTQLRRGASITANVDGAVASNNVPGRLVFQTASGGTTSERMRITSAGNVGIGLPDPTQPLQVAGNVRLGATTSGTQYSTVSILGDAAIMSSSPLLNLTTADGSTRFAYISHTGAGSQLDILNQSNGALTLGTNNTERARIDSSGRLLVGTSSLLTPINSVKQEIGNGNLAMSSFQANAYAYQIGFTKSRSASLIGTIVQNGDELGNIDWWGDDGTSTAKQACRIQAFVDGTPGANDMPGRLVFATTADGASSPTSRLVIKEGGDIVIPSTSATKGLWIGTGDAAGNGASANYRIGQNSTGVGSSTLYIGNAAIQVSSDARLKENIKDTTLSAVEELQRVRIVDFTWNDPSDTSYNNRNARGTWTGVIAQELIEVFPFAVNAPRKEDDLSIDHDSDSTWTVEQQQLVPVLIKAIQEQQAVITDLQSRLTALESV